MEIFIATPLTILFAIARYIWWIITPLVLFPIFADLWRYQRIIFWFGTLDFMLLEVKLPPEVEKTPKAMEVVFSGIHAAWSVIKWRNKWLEGELQPRFSFEIAGTGGEMHFYIRFERKFRQFIEAKIYSQYPDAEIFEVE